MDKNIMKNIHHKPYITILGYRARIYVVRWEPAYQYV
jgi:hypothetical protein